jgi:hypothetical protein
MDFMLKPSLLKNQQFPHLFILIAKGIDKTLSKIKSIGELKGIKLSIDTDAISLLEFVDDTLMGRQPFKISKISKIPSISFD